MKTKYGFYLLMLTFHLIACHDSLDCQNEPSKPNKEQGSYIDMSIIQNDDAIISRSLHSRNSVGDDIISDITFYLTDQCRIKTATGYEPGLVIEDIVKGTEIQQTGNLVKVKAHTKLENGIYLVIAIANSEHLKWNKQIKDTLQIFENISYNKELINQATSPYYFLMTNSGKSFIYPDFPKPEDIIINNKSFLSQFLSFLNTPENTRHSVINLNNNSSENPAKVNIYLDRFVAAIDAKSDNVIPTIKPYFDIINNDLSFTLNGFVTLNSPLIQNLIEISQFYTDDFEGGSIVLGDFLSTPYVFDFQENIEDMGWYNQIDTYSKIDSNNQVVDYKDASVKNRFNLQRKYVPENNTSTTGPPINNFFITNCRQGYVTGVIFQVKEINNHSFYVIKNGLQNKLYKYNKNDADEVNQIPSNAIKYEEGVMYYTYFIPDLYQYAKGQHYDVDLFYSVMRNTIYTLHLSSLSSLGGIYPGGDLPNPGNPDEEIDEDNLIKLGIKILVNPWIDGKTDIEL